MLDPQDPLARTVTIEPRRRRRPVVVALAATTVAFLASCGASGGRDAAASSTITSTTKATTTTIKAASGPATTVDCPSTDAVAGVLGGPVTKSMAAGGGMAASGSVDLGAEEQDDAAIEALTYGYGGCSYELTEGGQGRVAITRVTSETLDGPALYKALESGARGDAESNGFGPIEGVGKAAYRDGSDVVVQTGDAMLFVSFTDANRDDSFSSATTFAKAVVPLGLKGDGQPVDCEAVARAIPAELGSIEDTSVSGGSIGIDDLSIDTDGCWITFVDGARGKVMVGDPSNWDAWVTAKGGSSFTASFRAVAVGERSGFDDGEVLLIDDGKSPLRITAEGDDLDPGTAEVRVALAELVLGAK